MEDRELRSQQYVACRGHRRRFCHLLAGPLPALPDSLFTGGAWWWWWWPSRLYGHDLVPITVGPRCGDKREGGRAQICNARHGTGPEFLEMAKGGQPSSQLATPREMHGWRIGLGTCDARYQDEVLKRNIGTHVLCIRVAPWCHPLMLGSVDLVPGSSQTCNFDFFLLLPCFAVGAVSFGHLTSSLTRVCRV